MGIKGTAQQKNRARTLTAVILMLAAAPSWSALQQHTFTLAGSNGETGSGSFTWDDTVVANGVEVSGSPADFGNAISASFTISGGNVAGGSTTFSQANCNGAIFRVSPDFVVDINFFGCNDGTNSLDGSSPNFAFLNGTSSITFTPGITSTLGTPSPVASTPVPALPIGALVLLILGVAGLGSRVRVRR